MSSLNQEIETNMALPEQHPKRWKSRLQRFQSTLRQSMRLKKGYSPRSASFAGEEQCVDLANDNENQGAKRSSKHVRREILSKDNTVTHKQDNGIKTNSHSHYLNRKTSLDKSCLDKRKYEKNKTNGNNNGKEKKTTAKSSSSNDHVTELADCGRKTSKSEKRSQKSNRERANTNTERTRLSKSKSLSILTNLFKRSNKSKDKNNRGKSLSTSSQAAVSKELSTAQSANLDTLVTDIGASTSSIDSYGDYDFKRSSKYYSLKRSKGSLIFPKRTLPRAFSLDNSLDPCNPAMEKSRTLASIPPCIRVEEYRENFRGVLERALTVEFVPGSSGSVTNVTGPAFHQSVAGCEGKTLGGEVDRSLSSGTPRNALRHETGSNITPPAAKNNDAHKRHSAPPSLLYSVDRNSSNIGSPILPELKTDIALGDDNCDQIIQDSEGNKSKFLQDRNLPLESTDCGDSGDQNSDMGNNASYGQKPRKFNPRDATLKMEFLRPFKKSGKSFYRNATDGEADPIIEESDFLESYDHELENGLLNYYPAESNGPDNSLTKNKCNSLYEGSDALEDGKGMIDTFQKNYHERDSLDVKSTIDEVTDTEKQSGENFTTEEKPAYQSTESLSNDKVNNEEKVCEEHFCSTNCGQTKEDGSKQLPECLSCVKTRCELTDSQSMPCSPKFSESSSRKINTGGLNIQSLRDHISGELITCRLSKICTGEPGLAGKAIQTFKVNSLPSSPRQSLSPLDTSSTMYHSFPDIRKLHTNHLLPLNHLSDSTDSINSSCSLNVENSVENNNSIVDNGEEKATSPLSLSLDRSNGIKHGGILKFHLSPESHEERQRSCSARIPSRSPVQQVLLTENRSVSCSQLDKNNGSSAICSSPPYVRPRIPSLEQLPAGTAEVVLRKKRSIIRRNRMRHTTSLSCVDNVFNEMIDKGKRHSYGGYGDKLFLQLPHQLLQRSHSSESCNSCNSSQQSINSSSSLTENELGSTFSVSSEISFPGNFDVSLNRSRSVPGHLGGIPQNSPIPEERASISEMDWPSQTEENSDDEEPDEFDEMDVPEAFAEALWDHVTMDPEELSFEAGDIITVLTMTSCDWWFGQVGDRVGWFPAPFVRVRVSQTLAADETKLALPVRSRKGTNEGFLSDVIVRSRVVLEILSTERDYVKNLEDVVEGYLKQARKRTDMFTEEIITKIFSNIEQIYEFHQEILRQLEECFVEEDPCASEIGAVFLKNEKGFEIYSEYCNNHPHAMAEVKTLSQSNKYKQFFEACRLLQDMISISLDGFLLTPVQKICKYPLQLAELRKHTSPTHKDFQTVTRALETMKNVASLINERKRKVESINKIAKWQSTIEGWEGEDVLEKSSELIQSGDVIKTSNGSSQDRVMFLFDHQLVYCKKDILKKSGLTYKGRIDMDDCTVIWLKDGEETLDRSPLNNAWKIYNFKKEKWYIFYTKKAADKEKWMKAFKEERRRVREDAKTGLIISQNTRKAAMRAAKASVKHKKVSGKKEKPILKSQSAAEIKPPPSPTLRLPAPVSSADLKEEDEEEKDINGSPLSPRSSVVRRSFGLRGSKNKNKEKRKSSIF